MLSGILANGKFSVWDLSDLVGEGRELDNKAPAHKLFCSEVAHGTCHFCHIALAEASPVVRPDVSGVEKYNLFQEEKENI